MGTDGIEYLDGVGRDMDITVIAETKSRIECQRLNPTIKEVQPEALRTLTLCNKRRHISDRNGVANANVVLLRSIRRKSKRYCDVADSALRQKRHDIAKYLAELFFAEDVSEDLHAKRELDRIFLSESIISLTSHRASP